MASDPFGVLYKSQPRMFIHQSLRNCGAVLELAGMAKAKGFDVAFGADGHFTNDIKLNEGFDASAPLKSHSVRSAKRFLESHPGVA
jgi:hypothetical protein